MRHNTRYCNEYVRVKHRDLTKAADILIMTPDVYFFDYSGSSRTEVFVLQLSKYDTMGYNDSVMPYGTDDWSSKLWDVISQTSQIRYVDNNSPNQITHRDHQQQQQNNHYPSVSFVSIGPTLQ